MPTNFWQKLEKPVLALAPIAGVTDSAFRQICRQCGATVVYSEMTSAEGLYYKSKKTLEMLKFDRAEQPLVIQLFGKDPTKFSRAAKIVEKSGASGLDINFGCPARRVVQHGGGVTLMRNLELCYQIIQAVTENTKLPVSVKIRSSINYKNSKITALDFLKKIAKLPVAGVMIHGRSYEQGFSGEIDFAMIKDARKYFNGIILANGGIHSPEDAQQLLEKTGADGVGLARGVYGKPWLFKQINDYLANGQYSEPTWPEKKKIILNHAQLTKKTKGSRGLIELRKHLLWYVKGLSEAKKYRAELVKVKTIDDIKCVLKTVN
jgi:nifR3 family TIM-barrel protein